MKFSLFAKNALILTCSNTGLQILGFFYRMILNHFAGAEGLGIYQLVFSIYLVINTFCISGVVTAVTTLSASIRSGLQQGSQRGLIRRAVFVFLCGYSLAFAIVAVKADALSQMILGSNAARPALYMMLACLFLTGFENICKAFFIGIGRVKFAAISEIGEQTIRIFLVFCLLYCFYNGNYGQLAFWILCGMTGSEIASVLFLGSCYRKTIAGLSDFKKQKGKMDLLSFLRISVPISLSAFINNILESINSFLIPEMLILTGLTRSVAISQLGIISGAAIPILMLPIAVISAMSTNMVPKVSGTSSGYLTALANRALKTTGLIGIPATAAIMPLGTVAGRLLFGQEIPQKVFLILGISIVFLYYQMITASILNGMCQQKMILYGSLFSSVLQVLLTVLLVSRPELRIYGYLYATLAASIFLFFYDTYWLAKTVRISIRTSYLQPALCGAFLYAWSRFFYGFFYSVLQKEIHAFVFALAFSIFLYSVTLWVLNVRFRRKVG